MSKIYDLSATLSATGLLVRQPRIVYLDHEEMARQAAVMYGVATGDFPDGKYCATERISLGSHDTTHMDAPWHYGPTSEGRPSRTIDQIPLEWCFSDGVVLDFHHKRKGEGINAGEIRDALEEIGYKLKPHDIVLIRTDAYKLYGQPGYEEMHPGVTSEATLWLLRRGIKVVGTDAWGWDRPHEVMIQELKAGNRDQFWESHYLGKEHEYCHMERLANLDKLPRPFGFRVAAFPIKIERGSAGWVRAVAIFED